LVTKNSFNLFNKKPFHLGNAIVLAVGVIKRRYQNNVTNCYIMNLAMTDLLFLLISVPLTAYLGATKVWPFGEFLCKMHIYLAHVCLILFLTFTIGKYLGVSTSYLLYISYDEY
jgi:hypothetical protein